ncbi:MAG: M56 family metallopeptidase [Lachnospiraceae bacterium]|nr:M56 family metallopeptidase [Lachnospiraceae bacterium]
MAEHIISSTIFICLVLLLRTVFYNRLPKRLCYAMWLIVALHLLIPFWTFSNSFQVMNLVYRVLDVQAEPETGDDMTSESDWTYPETPSPGDWNETTHKEWKESGTPYITDEADTGAFSEEQSKRNQSEAEPGDRAETDGNKAVETVQMTERTDWIKGIWMLGVILCGMVFSVSNLYFGRKLRRDRQILEIGQEVVGAAGHPDIPVYQTKEVNVPCLFGLWHPAVYFPEAGAEQEDRNGEKEIYYVLEHELTHYKHRDHLWAMLRCLCVVLYWYHPLVWLAAFLSRRDSEFACDESVIQKMDEQKRRDYGETLILIGTQGGNAMKIFTCTTGMYGGKQELKKRITLIAHQGKIRLETVVLACTLLLAMTGCTLGSSSKNEEPRVNENETTENLVSEKTEEDTEEVSEEPTTEAVAEDMDMVSEPIVFDKYKVIEKVEENGIEYYKLQTEEFFPLPLDEWAPIRIFTQQGNTADAYVRFTDVTRETAQIEEYINQLHGDEDEKPFVADTLGKTEYVLLYYQIMVAEDTQLEAGDKILPMAVNYPLRMYSTLESRRFQTEESDIQGMERSVWDASPVIQDEIQPGDTIEKAVLCSVPVGYTAYGLELSYMDESGNTRIVYFKPEY